MLTMMMPKHQLCWKSGFKTQNVRTQYLGIRRQVSAVNKTDTLCFESRRLVLPLE